MTRGSRANHAAKVTEGALKAILAATGIEFDYQVVIGRTIYEKKWRVDFVLKNLADFPKGLVLESKWQDRRGSVEEKFPFLVRNIKERSPLPAIVVLHGGGHSAGAVRFLTNAIGGNFVAVYHLEAFISWIMRAARSETRRDDQSEYCPLGF